MQQATEEKGDPAAPLAMTAHCAAVASPYTCAAGAGAGGREVCCAGVKVGPALHRDGERRDWAAGKGAGVAEVGLSERASERAKEEGRGGGEKEAKGGLRRLVAHVARTGEARERAERRRAGGKRPGKSGRKRGTE